MEDELTSPTVQIAPEVNPVTATVTPPEPSLNDNQIASIAREMEWKVFDPAKIIAAAGITAEQFDYWVMKNAFYKKAYEVFLLEWEAANSTNKRIAIKSGALLEDSLKGLGVRIANDKEPLSSVVAAATLVAKLAGAGEHKSDMTPGEKFTINISLGAKHIRFDETISKPIIDVTPALEAPNAKT